MSKTLAIIKPDAVERGLVGEILTRIENKGFSLLAMHLGTMSARKANALYFKFRTEDFLPELVDYMTSGPSVVLHLEHPGPSAWSLMRDLQGTNEWPGTIRGDMALDFRRNSLHCSDCLDNYEAEFAIFFGGEYDDEE